ncbi:uncharacterized protein PV09_02601 [Verruconis gallopava]|uniref:Mitochondrial glycine transporter n=1 Tax=Verruconis gallopava TaxID=253628 RepID=A0A0D2AK53_9PEZI|nr:uncharacterized protein PV09_02601 [Verruconis gallopava]KIW06940.1 hypothetical protein PV09_02601 [Verruconis gallopava]
MADAPLRNGNASAGSKKAFHFLAGLTSGTFTAILLQPADLLKTRIQQSSHSNIRNPLLHTIRQIAASPAPVRQLWRGTVPSAWRTGLGSALYFGSLNVMRSKLAAAGIGTVPLAPGNKSSSALPKLSSTTNLLTGAVARTWAGFVMMPITVIKVRYESSFYNYTSLAAASRDILRAEGLRGFFAGFGATAVRDAPYAGLYVFGYEDCKKRLSKLTSGTSAGTNAVINFTSGVIAAGTATAITNPFDAIKTRLQLKPQRYGNMFRAAKMMVQEGGLRSLFDGLALRMARKAMSSALAWTVYEELIRRAEVRWLAAAKEAV